jgi:hypothetical protein
MPINFPTDAASRANLLEAQSFGGGIIILSTIGGFSSFAKVQASFSGGRCCPASRFGDRRTQSKADLSF